MPDPAQDDAVLEILREALERVNAVQPKEKIPFLPDAPLFGREGALNSHGLIRLAVNVQQLVAERFSVEIDLFDQRVFNLESPPFRTMRVLAEHIRTLLAHRDAAANDS